MDTTYGTCAHCSNPSTTKFCSGRCKSAEQYERIKQDPAKYRAYLDRVRAAQKKRHTPVPLPASMRCRCGKDFAPANTSQVYCSRGCRPRASNPTTIMRCDWCGADCVKERRGRRYAKTYCTLECRDKGLSNKGQTCTIPEDHWSRWIGKTSVWTPPKPKLPAFQCGQCTDCDAVFVEAYCPTPSAYCSTTCAKRAGRRRRRAREHNAPGDFRFSDLMRQYARQGYACAYCAQTCDGLPDPEHVTPLSRGGRNDMSNLVAACRSCNADKNDLTLDEWAADRERRGLPAVRTVLTGPAYRHLYHTTVTAPAWRNRRGEQMFERAA